MPGTSWYGRAGFSEGDPKYYKCLCHVRITTLVCSCIILFFCVASAIVASVAMALPDSHEYLGSKQINIEFAKHRENFLLAYRIVLGIIISGCGLHCLTMSLCIIGIVKVKPGFMVSELIIMGLFVGMLLFATVSIVISMVIILGFLWFLCVANAVIVLFTCYYFYLLIHCFKYIRDKRKSWRNQSDSSKSVRFTR